MTEQFILRAFICAAFNILAVCGVALAQDDEEIPAAQMVNEAITRGVEILVDRQEGKLPTEWPYEGVYRVRGEIPIGYRVGGTAIVCDALMQAPGFLEDEQRKASVQRGVDFIIESIHHDEMAHEFEATYDVRGWGYTYGLALLLKVEPSDDESRHDDKIASADMMAEEEKAREKAIQFFLDGIVATEIPGGGWNYARRGGFKAAGPPSPFMTGPTLQALFSARAQGYEVDEAMIERGLDALGAARTPTGSFMYAGNEGEKSRESVPGSVGRMLVSESTLLLAGRSSVDRVRGAIDAFLVHWQWLEQRRKKTGTHVRPYGIAPYYFYYAHYYAAQAIELLPQHERAEYRRRLRELLFSVREESGGWNDRIFPRSENYGTAMALLALMMPDAEVLPRLDEREE